MPMRHRLLLALRPEVVDPAPRMLVRAVERFYAERTGGGRTGCVTVVQRFGSSLNLNVHFHVLFLDGGYARQPDGALAFRPSPPPTHAELQALVEDVARRLDRLLARRGLGEDADVQPDDLQGRLQLSSATGHDALGGRPGSRTRRVAHVRPRRSGGQRGPGVLEASHAWFSPHAGTRVRAADRRGLELLARYVPRPAVALGRLGTDPGDDTVTLTFRQPWADGTGAIQLDPVDFVGRLAALCPVWKTAAAPKPDAVPRGAGARAPVARRNRARPAQAQGAALGVDALGEPEPPVVRAGPAGVPGVRAGDDAARAGALGRARGAVLRSGEARAHGGVGAARPAAARRPSGGRARTRLTTPPPDRTPPPPPFSLAGTPPGCVSRELGRTVSAASTPAPPGSGQLGATWGVARGRKPGGTAA
jgi:hypothetical protein